MKRIFLMAAKIIEELVLLRMELHAIRDRLQEDLNAMDSQIAALIPEMPKNNKTHADYSRELDEAFEKKFGK